MSETEDCIFCQIIEGEIPAYKVYEDDDVFAFLDVNPLSRGHTLVIPKVHEEKVQDLPQSQSRALFDAIYRLAEPVADAVGAPSSNIGINNGSEAGQEIPHLHAHIVPRKEGDGGGPIHDIMPEQLDLPDEEFEELSGQIRDKLG